MDLIEEKMAETVARFIRNGSVVNLGFGLPVLEAISLNCPVIVSNIETFHELMDSNAIFFNPQDEVDIVNKINLSLKNDKKVNSSKINSQMTFKLMTQRILSLYQNNLKDK